MSYVQVPADGVGKKVDTVTLTDALSEVHRQKIVLTGGSGTAEVVVVTNATPAAGDMALVVRQAGSINAVVSGTVNVNGGVAISGTAIVAGTVNVNGGVAISGTAQVAIATPIVVNNISATVQVSGGVAISGTAQVAIATPFTVNNISATVAIAGVVSLAAGTSNIGFINNISATVTVAGNVNISATPSVILAAGTANFGTLNDISRTVQVAIATPFTLNNISATTIVAGVISITAATTIGINSISATVTVVVSGYTPAIMAASHGPKCVTASTSSNVTLIAGPGAGLNIYVTQLMVGNFSGTLTKARIGTSASISTIVQPLAASGGGFVLNFDPPWMLSASEACLCSVKPNAADAFFTVNFFVK